MREGDACAADLHVVPCVGSGCRAPVEAVVPVGVASTTRPRDHRQQVSVLQDFQEWASPPAPYGVLPRLPTVGTTRTLTEGAAEGAQPGCERHAFGLLCGRPAVARGRCGRADRTPGRCWGW